MQWWEMVNNSLCKAVVFAPFLELRVCRRVSQEQKIDVK